MQRRTALPEKAYAMAHTSRVRPPLVIARSRIVITGASRGLGEQIASLLSYAGAQTVLVARDKERLRAVAARTGGEVFAADLSSRSQTTDVARAILDAGRVDVLVNNAALNTTQAFSSLRSRQIEDILEVNLIAPVLLTRAFLPGMQARRLGHIANIASFLATNAMPGTCTYATSKAGLSHFTAGLRADLKGTGITTTLATIGMVASEMESELWTHPPARAALERFERLRLTALLAPDDVATKIVRAIEKRRRYVRMPARGLLLPMMCEFPRQLTELFLAGVQPTRPARHERRVDDGDGSP